MNGELACLKSLFTEAIRNGICELNPVRGVKLLNPNNVRDRILSAEETAKLFGASEGFGDFVRPLFHVLYHTGIRLGEALALEWADIDFQHQRIVIRRSKSGEGRKAPLRSTLADELIRWKPKARGSRWIFPARYDAAKPMQSVRKGWLRLCSAAGLTDLRPDDLRHNFTGMLQAQGVSDSIIMSITGHKTHVMLHRYSHSNDPMRIDAVERLPVPTDRVEQKVTHSPEIESAFRGRADIISLGSESAFLTQSGDCVWYCFAAITVNAALTCARHWQCKPRLSSQH